jgi:hypothetical protein
MKMHGFFLFPTPLSARLLPISSLIAWLTFFKKSPAFFCTQPRIGNEQDPKILNHMLSGKSITAFETLRLFGCLRLGAMIHDIR